MKALLPVLSVISILSAQAGTGPDAQPVRLSQKRSVQTKAVICGVETNKTYPELPPVLVELSHLPVRATVWVEVKRSTLDATPALPVTVKSRFFLRRGTSGVLDVRGLHAICRPNGTWTMTVFMDNALGRVPLASTTFRTATPPPFSSPVSALPALPR